MQDLTGMRFGRLVVQSFDRIEKCGKKSCHYYWYCKCDCGNVISTRVDKFKSGKVISCGCYQKERAREVGTKHGKYHTRLYVIWSNMKQRCYNPKNNNFIYYGKKGIKLCKEWEHDFQAFYDWAMENGYTDNLTIDRIDTNGNYEPSNCRWVTMKIQVSNRGPTKRKEFIEHNGKRLSDELKPCPFCCGEADTYKSGWRTIVYCLKCGAKIMRKIADEAIAAWNRRYK